MDFLDCEMEEELIDEDEGCTDDEEDMDHHQQHRVIERYACDTCEKEFNTYWQQQKHMSEHKTCNIDGCTFTAHEKIITKHIQMQHYSGLYDKIKNVSTPEDIDKWIIERKKRYPSKENIEKRYKQQEEILKRGEKLTKDSRRFDRKNRTKFSLAADKHKRFQHKKKPTKRKSYIQKNKSVSCINDKSDWNGTMFPFRGTNQLYNEETINNDVDNIVDEDDEWMHTDKNNIPENVTASNESVKKENTSIASNALGALMSAYNNSDDSDIEEMPPGENEVANITSTSKIDTEKCEVSVVENDSDDEPPSEEKIGRLEVPFLKEEQNLEAKSKLNESTSINVKVKHGHKRKRTKRKGGNNSKDMNDTQNKVFYKKRRITLLERLLANEIVHERNVLLQCIKYVVENDFFDKKETEK